ncbi:MAG: hypothetical protein IPP32_16155 [Bacteroidetes bacterium]|nr:hypothetical protein [Bacteroidota bacterium]
MLLGEFYLIEQIQPLENFSFKLRVRINPSHAIFEGHFPGNPIVPGVCLTQMTMEIIESIQNCSLQLRKADNIKFTAIVNPNENPLLDANLALKFAEDNRIIADLSFYSGETVFFKFKGSFVPQEV